LTIAGEVLHCRAPPGALSDDLRAAMRAQKAELLALLEPEAGTVARPGLAVARAGGRGESVPTAPTSERDGLLISALDVGAAVRIPLDDLVYGDFLERNRLRTVDGTAHPDGRTFRPTIYLADDPG
jgi:hypothetical protein